MIMDEVIVLAVCCPNHFACEFDQRLKIVSASIALLSSSRLHKALKDPSRSDEGLNYESQQVQMVGKVEARGFRTTSRGCSLNLQHIFEHSSLGQILDFFFEFHELLVRFGAHRGQIIVPKDAA